MSYKEIGYWTQDRTLYNGKALHVADWSSIMDIVYLYMVPWALGVVQKQRNYRQILAGKDIFGL